ncbi:hypothetical protein CB1_000218001 [Camelus ferus]|nr:hypothetical protein CB1_000218001 [Camelus ferus]
MSNQSSVVLEPADNERALGVWTHALLRSEPGSNVTAISHTLKPRSSPKSQPCRGALPQPRAPQACAPDLADQTVPYAFPLEDAPGKTQAQSRRQLVAVGAEGHRAVFTEPHPLCLIELQGDRPLAQGELGSALSWELSLELVREMVDADVELMRTNPNA